MDNPCHPSWVFLFFLSAAAAAAASSFCQRPPLLSSGQFSSILSPDDITGVDAASGSPPAIYIVHVTRPEHMVSAGTEELEAWHTSFLPTPLLVSGEPRMVFSYRKAISGFAAWLTAEEVEVMRGVDGVLAADPDEPLEFQTTYVPDFMELRDRSTGDWMALNKGDGVIIGVVDSGINPRHDSFNDSGMPDPPAGKWNGSCQFNGQRTCNKKLLGAMNFDKESKKLNPMPFDEIGHGTHVAATAAGRVVTCANVKDLARGAASGAAPRAHLAMYKASTTSEGLKAIEQAMKDGVDIISMSLVWLKTGTFDKNKLAIGALSAVKKGILVVACASNDGPREGTIRNEAPWILTVGASTTDRIFKTTITLGNGEAIQAESLYVDSKEPLAGSHRLVYPGRDGNLDALSCRDLRGAGDVSNMIVLCHTDVDQNDFKGKEQAEAVMKAGGAAIILMNSDRRGNTISGIPNVAFPAICTDFCSSSKIVGYVKAEDLPTAQIYTSDTAFDGPHPFPAVAFFSARGPSDVNGGILKPDVVAPGVNVLAADFSCNKGFVLMSGTSMATPLVAGIAAILNHSHPEWTPAMIKSALMTTAERRDDVCGDAIVDKDGVAANLHAMGSGQVKPLRSDRPGLVYKLEHHDYLQYLCGLGYSKQQIQTINHGEVFPCTEDNMVYPEDLNYPSIWVKLKLGKDGAAPPDKVVSRTVTSVESGISSYEYRLILKSEEVEVSVSPPTLDFREEGQQEEYKVTFTVRPRARRGEVSGRLIWRSSKLVVATPLMITISDEH